MLYRVRTLTSHNAEESEKSPESQHLGEIKRMRKQCVPGASLFFAHAGDGATLHLARTLLGECGALWGEREQVVWSICVAQANPLLPNAHIRECLYR